MTSDKELVALAKTQLGGPPEAPVSLLHLLVPHAAATTSVGEYVAMHIY